jgi:hypothetical protein
LLAADMDPILAPERHRAHGVLRPVVAQLQFWIIQEATQPGPKAEGVIAGFGQSALWQCAGASRFNPGSDDFKQRLGLLQASGVTLLLIKRLARAFRSMAKST